MPLQEPESRNLACQIACVENMSAPLSKKEMLKQPLQDRLKLALKRGISPRHKRTFKHNFENWVPWFSGNARGSRSPSVAFADISPARLQAGDLVRVRTKEQIQSSLNSWKELKGCQFMPEMWQYCGTTQRVLKPVERFVDERDYRVKKASGVYLLEGAICQGTELYGRCDRACFYFWREEWLEKTG